MRHPEGLRLSIVDESTLDTSGILKGPVTGQEPRGLPASSVELFLQVAAAGPSGLQKCKVAPHLKPVLPEALVPLELENLVVWERDNRGNLAYLVLTWRGQEALDAARPAKRSGRPPALQRRVSLGR